MQFPQTNLAILQQSQGHILFLTASPSPCSSPLILNLYIINPVTSILENQYRFVIDKNNVNNKERDGDMQMYMQDIAHYSLWDWFDSQEDFIQFVQSTLQDEQIGEIDHENGKKINRIVCHDNGVIVLSTIVSKLRNQFVDICQIKMENIKVSDEDKLQWIIHYCNGYLNANNQNRLQNINILPKISSFVCFLLSQLSQPLSLSPDPFSSSSNSSLQLLTFLSQLYYISQQVQSNLQTQYDKLYKEYEKDRKDCWEIVEMIEMRSYEIFGVKEKHNDSKGEQRVVNCNALANIFYTKSFYYSFYKVYKNFITLQHQPPRGRSIMLSTYPLTPTIIRSLHNPQHPLPHPLPLLSYLCPYPNCPFVTKIQKFSLKIINNQKTITVGFADQNCRNKMRCNFRDMAVKYSNSGYYMHLTKKVRIGRRFSAGDIVTVHLITHQPSSPYCAQSPKCLKSKGLIYWQLEYPNASFSSLSPSSHPQLRSSNPLNPLFQSSIPNTSNGKGYTLYVELYKKELDVLASGISWVPYLDMYAVGDAVQWLG